MDRRIAIAGAILAISAPAFAGSTEVNIKAAISGLQANKIKWETTGAELCINDQACSIMVGNVQVNAVGYTIEAMTTSQDPASKYQKTCAAILAGLLETDIRSATSYVLQGFDDASRLGAAKYTIGKTSFKVSPSFDDRLGCEFVRK
jgi:hypothetical protein